MTIGEKLRAMIGRNGLTLATAARACDLDKTQLWKILTDRVKNPGYLTVEKIVRAVGGSMVDLIDDPAPSANVPPQTPPSANVQAGPTPIPSADLQPKPEPYADVQSSHADLQTAPSKPVDTLPTRTPKPLPLTDSLRARIGKMKRDGLPTDRIARLTKLDARTVAQVVES